jgi:HK97 family phage major capsid protein
MRLQALREQRASKAKEARNLLDSTTTDWNADAKAKVDDIYADIDRITSQIEALEKADQFDKFLTDDVAVRAVETRRSVDQTMNDDAKEKRAFAQWLVSGFEGLEGEARDMMAARRTIIQANQSTGTGSAGGFAVPPSFLAEIERAMLAYGAVKSISRVIPSDVGSALAIPTLNDTNNVGRIIAENAALTNTALVFGQTSLPVYMYSSDSVLMSYQMMQDAVLVESLLPSLLGERLGRITNAHFTTGTGTGQPQGVMTGATSGAVGATGNTTTVPYVSLVALQHSVDPIYRTNARWMMHDTSLRAIKGLVDGQQRPLWLPGVASSEPDTILGQPYVINQQVAQMAANARSIAFGDFSNYYVREVRGMSMRRLEERYADNLQVGFFAFGRWGGVLVDGGTNPIKFYQNSAT